MAKLKTKTQEFILNNKKIKVLIYVLLILVVYGVCNTSVYYASLMPFGIGIVFALLYIGFNGYLLSLVYFVAYILASLSFNGVFEALNVCLVLSGIEFAYSKKTVLKLRKWQIFVLSLFAQVIYVFLNLGETKENLALFVSIILGELFLYACLSFFEAVCKKGMFAKLSVDEVVCGGVILIIFMAGMSATNISIINLGLIFVTLFILVFTYISKPSVILLLSTISGIGFGLLQINPIYISCFLVLAICSLVFKCKHKVFSSIAVVLGYIIFNLFFNAGIVWGDVLSVCIGGLVFLLVPLRLLCHYDALFNKKNNLIYNSVLNNSKKQLIKRISELGFVFGEMTDVYRSMVKGVLNDESAVSMLKGELLTTVCMGCPNHDVCFRTPGSFLDNAMDNIVQIAYDKNKLLLIDLPQYLTSNCIKVNQIINTLNSLVVSYRGYVDAIKNMDASRVLIADQLQGVSLLLDSLSKEINVNINIDCKYEALLKERLSAIGVVCLDVLVYEKDVSTKYITLIVKDDDINDKNIEKIVSKILSHKVKIISKEPSSVNGAIEIYMETEPNYDIAIGSSVGIKNGKNICGDTHSFVKIEEGKYMVSICDGMGSGKKARDISALTISLVEKFYRAGFENEIIINSINKLLSLTEEENYSTIDLCVIDAKKNVYDFIKLGACNGYIKRDRGEIEVIEGSNLPIGVLEDIRPHITRRLLCPMDMLILLSDGVVDSFAGVCDIKDYINSLDILNPQTLSDTIKNKAIELNGGVSKDDMTVLCVRVFET